MSTIEAERQLDLDALRATINRKLEHYLPEPECTPSPLAEAMRYTIAAGGKRLRPLLLCAAHRASGGIPDENLWRAAAAVEYLHTFSLVHDDLPCMDDDDLRRGLPTAHKKFGEGMAVLAGDALAVLAFELLGETGNCDVVIALAQAIGARGMIAGQVGDLAAEGREVSLVAVQQIHRCKTAALFRGCARGGGLLAGVDDKRLEALTVYGEKLGTAFQIVDDLLDLEGDTEHMGKRAGADLRRGKATYPGASSPDRARADAREAARAAREALDAFEDRVTLLALVDLAVAREA